MFGWDFIDSDSFKGQRSNVLKYTCLSIFLATFRYRVRGTCVPARAFHARLAR